MVFAPSTLAGWITAIGASGSFVTLLTVILRFKLGSRRLDNEERGDIRDHYAKELEALRQKLTAQEENFRRMEAHWRKMLEESDRRHDECEDARQLLRIELDKMHSEIRGLKDQIRMQASQRVWELPPDAGNAPLARESADRVPKILEEKGDAES